MKKMVLVFVLLALPASLFASWELAGDIGGAGVFSHQTSDAGYSNWLYAVEADLNLSAGYRFGDLFTLYGTFGSGGSLATYQHYFDALKPYNVISAGLGGRFSFGRFSVDATAKYLRCVYRSGGGYNGLSVGLTPAYCLHTSNSGHLSTYLAVPVEYRRTPFSDVITAGLACSVRWGF